MIFIDKLKLKDIYLIVINIIRDSENFYFFHFYLFLRKKVDKIFSITTKS